MPTPRWVPTSAPGTWAGRVPALPQGGVQTDHLPARDRPALQRAVPVLATRCADRWTTAGSKTWPSLVRLRRSGCSGSVGRASAPPHRRIWESPTSPPAARVRATRGVSHAFLPPHRGGRTEGSTRKPVGRYLQARFFRTGSSWPHLVQRLLCLRQPRAARLQCLFVLLGLALVPLGPGLVQLALQTRDGRGELVHRVLGPGPRLGAGAFPLGLLVLAHTVLDLAEGALELVANVTGELAGLLPGFLELTQARARPPRVGDLRDLRLGLLQEFLLGLGVDPQLGVALGEDRV